jgi:hypothetical protein
MGGGRTLRRVCCYIRHALLELLALDVILVLLAAVGIVPNIPLKLDATPLNDLSCLMLFFYVSSSRLHFFLYTSLFSTSGSMWTTSV